MIFLLLAGLLVLVGLFYPTHTRKTPQNSREIRQGDTIDWIKEVAKKERHESASKQNREQP